MSLILEFESFILIELDFKIGLPPILDLLGLIIQELSPSADKVSSIYNQLLSQHVKNPYLLFGRRNATVNCLFELLSESNPTKSKLV